MNLDMSLEDVLAARVRIRPHVHKTPLWRLERLSRRLGCELYIKAEHLQKTGSFKARGAMNFLSVHPSENGNYTTYSSGNHGQAVCWAARRHRASARIFMPEDASPAKVAAVRAYGGEVVFAGLSNLDRRRACEDYADKEGAVVVPPYDHETIIAGQGTVMLEVLEEEPFFDAALIPVGGGGLLGGNALVLSELGRETRVYACEPEAAADVQAGLAAGERQTIPYPDTMADGLRNLCVGDRNWAIIRRRVREGLTCGEGRIVEAMGLLANFAKQWVEPSGAVGLACLLEHASRFCDKKVVVVLSGGNLALEQFATLVERYAVDLG